jgi:hypothetical protein
MRILSDAQQEIIYIISVEFPMLKNENNFSQQHTFLAFFTEKEVNGLMEELFETVSNDP